MMPIPPCAPTSRRATRCMKLYRDDSGAATCVVAPHYYTFTHGSSRNLKGLRATVLPVKLLLLELSPLSNIPLFRAGGTQTGLKGQYNAELPLSPRLHVKPLITTIRVICLIFRNYFFPFVIKKNIEEPDIKNR